MRPRPDYIRRKAALETQRREAIRTHAKPCDCAYCMAPGRAAELMRAALARNPGAGEEVPF